MSTPSPFCGDWRAEAAKRGISGFARAVFELTAAIPAGRVATYGSLAAALGCASSQAVGSALHHNPFAPAVPCHRIVKSKGTSATIGGFCGAIEGSGSHQISRKVQLLKSEGVSFEVTGALSNPKVALFQPDDWPVSAKLAAAAFWKPKPSTNISSDMPKKASAASMGSAADAATGVGSKRPRASASAPSDTKTGATLSAGTGAPAGLRERLGRPGATGLEVRLAARSGALSDHTSGLAPGIAQANLVILPRENALDFLAFCTRNPKPCPLLEVTDTGVCAAPRMAPSGCDIRTDCPRYRVWRNGVLAEEVTDIRHLWPDADAGGAAASSSSSSSSKGGAAAGAAGAGAAPKPAPDARRDWVAFLLGCSFSFEEALLSAGLPVRHLQEEKAAEAAAGAGTGAAAGGAGAAAPKKARKASAASESAGAGAGTSAASSGAGAVSEPLAANPRNVPMYRTCVPCEPAGPFSGPLVVSMRPMKPEQAVAAAAVTDRFPRVHGRPVFAGAATAIGIADVGKPDYGDAVTIRESEVPVFWACGVTPQAALLQAKVPIAITHAPGHMLVLDKRNAELAGPAELDVSPFLQAPGAAGRVL